MVQPDVEGTIVAQGLTQRAPLQRYTSNQASYVLARTRSWILLDTRTHGYTCVSCILVTCNQHELVYSVKLL